MTAHEQHDSNKCRQCSVTMIDSRDELPNGRSWSFGMVCNWCSYHASKVTSRHNKRCRKKGKEHRLTKFDWLSVLCKHDFSCAGCGAHGIKLTLDHKVKLADGGDNGWWNVQPLCEPCHKEKDDTPPSRKAA